MEATTKRGWVYLIANPRTRQTYLGVTSNLTQRIWQHRNEVVESYSRENGCTALVWFEAYDDLQDARARELQMKKWKRDWKLELIERDNPQWNDLYDTLF